MRTLVIVFLTGLALSASNAVARESDIDRAIRQLARSADARDRLGTLGGNRAEAAKSADATLERIAAVVDYFGNRAVRDRAIDRVKELHRDWLSKDLGSAGRLYRMEFRDESNPANGATFAPIDEQVLPLSAGSVPEAIYRSERTDWTGPIPPSANLNDPSAGVEVGYVYMDREGRSQLISDDSLKTLSAFDPEIDAEFQKRSETDKQYSDRQKELAQAQREAQDRIDQSRAEELKRRAADEQQQHQRELADRETVDRERADNRRRDAEALDEWERRKASNGDTQVAKCASDDGCRSDTPGASTDRPKPRACRMLCQDVIALEEANRLLGDDFKLETRNFGRPSLVDLRTNARATNLPRNWQLSASPYGIAIGRR